jgi:hypothetical protein
MENLLSAHSRKIFNVHKFSPMLPFVRASLTHGAVCTGNPDISPLYAEAPSLEQHSREIFITECANGCMRPFTLSLLS